MIHPAVRVFYRRALAQIGVTDKQVADAMIDREVEKVGPTDCAIHPDVYRALTQPTEGE